jgi:hypothetical protein
MVYSNHTGEKGMIRGHLPKPVSDLVRSLHVGTSGTCK